MSREDLHFRLRMPAELKAAIEHAAGENRRSMTAEIVARLEGSFDWPVLSTALRRALEDSADANNQSVEQEILSRLEFTRGWDSDFFNPRSDNAVVLDPNYRLGAIENRLNELTELVRRIAAPNEGSDDNIPL